MPSFAIHFKNSKEVAVIANMPLNVCNRDGFERTWGDVREVGRFPQPIFKCSSLIDIDSPRAETSLPSRVTLPFRDNYG